MRLRCKVVDFVRLNSFQDAPQAGAVSQIAVVQRKLALWVVRVTVQVIDSSCRKRTAAADYPVDSVTLGYKQLG
jgi:hypothetical protein